MKLLTSQQEKKLLANGLKMQEVDISCSVQPVVKLFMPDGAGTWLLAWIDPCDRDIAWGLCDLGLGFPELGTVSLSELAELRGALGLNVERDKYFKANKTLSEYADEAKKDRYLAA